MEIQKLDPKSIFPTSWTVQESPSDTAFLSLKADIESQGGNVVPIKVRPSHATEGTYDIVFGQRRHQACLELGINVLAFVEAMTDVQLVNEMDRENRFRKDPCAYKRGTLFAMALDYGLFPSQRRMCEKLGINLISVSNYLSVARLPPQILRAFQNPSCIKEKWGIKIIAQLHRNPDVLLSRAQELAVAKRRMTANQIYRELTK